MNTLIGIRNLIVLTSNSILYPYVSKVQQNFTVHDQHLLKSRLPLLKKIDLLSDERTTRYWNILTNNSGTYLNNREDFNINIEKHIKEFDPSGITNGCGCDACKMNHKIFLLKTSIGEQKVLYKVILEIDALIDKGVELHTIINSIKTAELPYIQQVESYGKYTNRILGYVHNSFIRKKNPGKFKRKKTEILFSEWRERVHATVKAAEIKLTYDLSAWQAGLHDLCMLCGIPMKMGKLVTLKDKSVAKEARNKLVSLPYNDIERAKILLSMDINKELIPFAKALRLKNLKKEARIERIQNLQRAINSLVKNDLDGDYQDNINIFRQRLRKEVKKIINKINKEFIKHYIP